MTTANLTKRGKPRQRAPGAGRKSTTATSERMIALTITLTAADIETLKAMDSNLSRAVRQLIAGARDAKPQDLAEELKQLHARLVGLYHDEPADDDEESN